MIRAFLKELFAGLCLVIIITGGIWAAGIIGG